MQRRRFTGALLGLAAAAASPASALARPQAGSAAQIDLVATTGMIADTAQRIGGDALRVRALMGPGVDPHAYRQTSTDIRALTRADLVLWHGLYLEAQLERLLLQLGRRRKVVPVGEAVPTSMLLAHEDYPDKFDPHVWMDPIRWCLVARRIEAELSAAAPADSARFKVALAAFEAELMALDAYARKVLQSVPRESRVLVTAHDAFNYFGAAYGFEVVGVQGISTESEAGVSRIRELVDLLVKRRIGAVFVESSVSDRNMRALIEGAAARGHKVVVGGELFSDAMGQPGAYEGEYLGMIDHNVTTIARALGGSAPPRGRLGRLQEPMQPS